VAGGRSGGTGRDDIFGSFARDVARAWHSWRRDPRLPATAVAIAFLTGIWDALADLSGVEAISVIMVVAAIYFLGFNGTAPLWCIRLDRGHDLPWADVRRVTRGLRWRYFRLFLLIGVVGIVPIAAVLGATSSGALRDALLGLLGTVVFTVFGFALVAAAFNDVRAWDSIRHSLTVLRREWPECAAYLVVPAVGFTAALAATRALGVGPAAGPVASVVLAPARLLCDNALALFYADRYPTLRDGDPATDAQLRRRGGPAASAGSSTQHRPSAPPTVPPPGSTPTGTPRIMKPRRSGSSPFRPPPPP